MNDKQSKHLRTVVRALVAEGELTPGRSLVVLRRSGATPYRRPVHVSDPVLTAVNDPHSARGFYRRAKRALVRGHAKLTPPGAAL